MGQYGGDTVARGHVSRSGPALLGIYLNDHLAGATMGTELAFRLAGAHRGSEESATFERLATEIAEDRAALVELMSDLEVPVRQYKVVLGWVAEKTGRFKPNGRLLGRSPLSSLEEVEVIRLGVEGKAACWQTLLVVADQDDRLDRARLDELLRRADEQAETLEELRIRVTAELTDVL
ncbi:MAG TPA: hypothetical protein VE198_01935 [Actinoallomurus sp.]|nr:hypothetical protein [Actinoallomurus sp.]